MLCLDRWFAPALITSINQPRIYRPSLEAEYAWRLTQIPYCGRITQENILGFRALARFKVFLVCWITCFLPSPFVNYLKQQQACTLSDTQSQANTPRPFCSSCLSLPLPLRHFSRNPSGGLAARYRPACGNDGWEIACAGEWSGSYCWIKEAMDCYWFLSDTIISFGLRSPSWCIVNQSIAEIF